MISGQVRTSLTIDRIFEMISEYDVYKYYMPHTNWSMNVTTLSPFRVEKVPSFRIYDAYGALNHIDFSDTRFRGGCIDFLMQLYNIRTVLEAITKIDKDFGLTSTQQNAGNYKQIISQYLQPQELGRRVSFIQVKTRKFTNEELEYWNQYHLGIDDLKENHVYSISKLYLNRKAMPLKDSELRFGYHYDGYWKIYKPFAEKRDKWFPNNVPNRTFEGMENLVLDKPAFVNKSKKDYMVMKKLYPHCCSVQNEGMSCFTVENVELLNTRSSSRLISFDSDEAGLKASKHVTETFGYKHVNVPNAYLREGIKDWSDLAKVYGMNVIKHYLKQKYII